MIGYIKGEIAAIFEDKIVIENCGVGYNIFMPVSSMEYLDGIGSTAKIYTYLSVREDAMQLYGFITREDLEIFKLLIQVNGIGPKGALAILSVMTTDNLKFAILSSDAKTISKAPGIGAKTAQRVIIDLKDKVSINDAINSRLSSSDMTDTQGSDASNQSRNEAVMALTALGYSSSDSYKAVRSSDITNDDDVETIIKKSLKILARL